MKAMIFAAGLGTRLKPITDTIPKALLPLNGKTLLQYQIEKLKSAGITDIVINVHHFADQIINYLAQNNNFGCNILISDECDQLLDTGGGLLKAAPLLLGMQAFDEDNLNYYDLSNNESILVCNVDILSNIDLPTLLSSHSPSDYATLVVSQRETQRYLLFDQVQRLIGWTNIATGEVKPQGVPAETVTTAQRLAFSGMQVVSPKIFPIIDLIRGCKGKKFSMIDVYLAISTITDYTNSKEPSIRAFIPQNYRMMDVGKINQLSQAEKFAKQIYQ